MSIATFTIVRNEAPWIAAHVLRILPHVDGMVFYDGNSTDGTLQIIEAIQRAEPGGDKILLVKDRDPKDLKDDYVRVFNECLSEVKADHAFFAHPDFWIVNPERIAEAGKSPSVAQFVNMRSFGGEPGGQLYEIKGRGQRWKVIHSTMFDLRYHGHYGAWNEDIYPTAIVGESREFHGENLHWYPYAVEDSGIEVLHFSDVRPIERRYGRMVTCLTNQGKPNAEEQARRHPRVTLKDGNGFKFVKADYPPEFLAARAKYQHLERTPCLTRA